MKNQSESPQQFFEDAIMMSSVSEYKTNAGGGGLENGKAAGETHVVTHRKKYGHTQGTPAETNPNSDLIP